MQVSGSLVECVNEPSDFIRVDIGPVFREELTDLVFLAATEFIKCEHVAANAWDNAGDAIEVVGFEELLEFVHLGHVADVDLILVVYRCVKVGREDGIAPDFTPVRTIFIAVAEITLATRVGLERPLLI